MLYQYDTRQDDGSWYSDLGAETDLEIIERGERVTFAPDTPGHIRWRGFVAINQRRYDSFSARKALEILDNLGPVTFQHLGGHLGKKTTARF